MIICTITVNKEVVNLQPQTTFAGYAGENHATQLIMGLPDTLYGDTRGYTLQFHTADCRHPRYMVTPDEDHNISFDIPAELMVCGNLDFQLEVYDPENGGDCIVKTSCARVTVANSVNEGCCGDIEYCTELNRLEHSYTQSMQDFNDLMKQAQHQIDMFVTKGNGVLSGIEDAASRLLEKIDKNAAAGSGCADSILLRDETAEKDYIMQFKLVDGKPVITYSESEKEN